MPRRLLPQDTSSAPIFLLVVSLLVLAAILVKIGMQKLRLPAVVGYLFLGLALRAFDESDAILTDGSRETLDFLGQLGVASLLFHVGLSSNLNALIAVLPRAAWVWVSDVAFSSAIGFFTARALGFGLAPSLFVGVALSATSVGISVTVWEDVGAMGSRIGRILLDVAELDDLSAVVLLLIALSVTPSLQGGALGPEVFSVAAGAVGALALKLAAFAIGCWVFSAFVEKRLSEFFARFRRAPDPLLTLVGFGFGIAALAGWLGFSVAVGALFAGLMFSRDPEAVKLEAGFSTIYSLFTPFFFINIGYGFDPKALGAAAGLGAVLFLAAVAGKFIGAGLPLVFREGWKSATVLGISMAPRAEIALLAAQMGKRMGVQAMPDELYGGIVLACAAASIMSPLALHGLLEKWPEVLDGSEEETPA